jgi:hypothetical protein
LEEIGLSSNVESLRDAMNNIFDENSPSEHNAHQINSVLSKGKGLLSLIKNNIKTAQKSTNFQVDPMLADQSEVQDIIFRIESIKSVSKDQLIQMNLIHRTHSKIQKLIKPIANPNK